MGGVWSSNDHDEYRRRRRQRQKKFYRDFTDGEKRKHRSWEQKKEETDPEATEEDEYEYEHDPEATEEDEYEYTYDPEATEDDDSDVQEIKRERKGPEGREEKGKPDDTSFSRVEGAAVSLPISRVPLPLCDQKYLLTEEQLQFFDTNGYLVIENVIDNKQSNATINEIWNVLTNLPRKEAFKIRIPPGVDVRGDIPKATLKEWNALWPPHKQFGAPCEPPLFHLQTGWENRQNPNIACKFMQLMNHNDVWVGLNRYSIKLPGQGETEFMHWDDDPWFWHNPENKALVQGMLFLEPGTFLAVPKTHTVEFAKRFTEHYKYLAPSAKNKNSPRDKIAITLTTRKIIKRNTYIRVDAKRRRKMNAAEQKVEDAKVAIAQAAEDLRYETELARNDPLRLESKVEAIRVPKNALLVWSSRMLHMVKPNKTKRVRYAQYIGYRPAGSMQKLNNPVLGLSERMDRLRSFYEGKVPFSYPSGDPVQYMPKKWKNFHKIVAAYQQRLPEPLSEAKRLTISGKLVPIIREYDPKSRSMTRRYALPILTPFGRQILGLTGTRFPHTDGVDFETTSRLIQEFMRATEERKVQIHQELVHIFYKHTSIFDKSLEELDEELMAVNLKIEQEDPLSEGLGELLVEQGDIIDKRNRIIKLYQHRW